MIPIQLTLSGFLSYRDSVELDFTLFDLACIAGTNGAGKSSLLDAITWALFGRARRRDDALINARCDAAEVSLTFAYEGNIYRILRAKPRQKTTILELFIHQDETLDANLDLSCLSPASLVKWKPLTERALRDTEDRIRQILRLDYDTFVNASFFLQGRADQFTQQEPAERKRILSNILGLEIWETYRAHAIERHKEIERQIGGIDLHLREIEEELAQETNLRNRLDQLRRELQNLEQMRSSQENVLEQMRTMLTLLEERKKLVEERFSGLQAAQERLKNLEEQFQQRQTERQTYLDLLERAEQIEANYAALKQMRHELERWEALAARYRERERQRQPPLDEINAARARLTQELETLQSRLNEIERTQAEISRLGEEVANLQASIQAKEERLALRPSLEAEMQECQQVREQLSAENRQLQTEMKRLKERVERLEEATEQANCPLCGQPLSPRHRQSLIAELIAEGKTMGDHYRENLQRIAVMEQDLKMLKSRLEELIHLDSALRQQQGSLAEKSTRLHLLEAQWTEWEENGAPRLAEIRRMLEEESFALEARARLAQVEAELQAIGYDAEAHEAARRAVVQQHAAEDEFRNLEVARASLSALEREVARLQQEVDRQKSEVARLEESYRQASDELAELQKKAPDVKEAEATLYRIREDENRKRFEVGQAEQRIKVLEEQKVRRKQLLLDREYLGRRSGYYKQLELAFSNRGVPALIIEQALPQIEVKANRILERLSMGSMSVRFVTQAPLKDKRRQELREVLDIEISDGLGLRAYEMYSGGEAFRINFAIRLALAEVLAQRAGARLQTLVIDEGFGSQDDQGRQRLIEAINEVRRDFAKILVITHLDELKDHFPTRIEVEKSERGSTLRIV